MQPAKAEMWFRRQAAVADAVREAVRNALGSAAYAPPQERAMPAYVNAPFVPPQPQPRIEYQYEPPSGDEIACDVAAMIQKESVESVVPQSEVPQVPQVPPVPSAEKFAREVVPESISPNIRPLGQLDESFIIATDDQGLLLIDQHVAHERVLFDKYRALEAARQIDSQQLLVPETFDLTPAQAAVFDNLAPELENYGFELMRLDRKSVV